LLQQLFDQHDFPVLRPAVGAAVDKGCSGSDFPVFFASCQFTGECPPLSMKKGEVVMNVPEFLTPGRCALLVVDIQERLMPLISGREEVSRNTVLLLKGARVLKMPVLATTQYAARIGGLIPEVQAELDGVTPLDKMHFSCFGDPEVRARISRLLPAVNTLIVCGVETHICIYQTVLGALRDGFRVVVPADAVSSRTVKNYELGLARMRELGAVVASTEMVLYELLNQAGTPAFKELLPFLK
jgi:nicotinamidase-related amidase